MIDSFKITARDLCLFIAALLVIDVIAVMAWVRDPFVAIATILIAVFAYWTGGSLANPAELLKADQAFVSAIPAAIAILGSIVSITTTNHNWTVALCIIAGYMMGNRVRAAGPLRLRG